MDKLVRTVFSVLMVSFIMFIVSDVIAYMYRVQSLNYQMEGIVNTLYTTCSTYNYIPKEVMRSYCGDDIVSDTGVAKSTARVSGNVTGGILGDVKNTFNRIHDTGATTGYRSKDFVEAINVNYRNEGSVGDDLSVLGKLGDTKQVEIQVLVNVPVWGIDFSNSKSAGDIVKMERKTTQRVFTYTKKVPCLKYNK